MLKAFVTKKTSAAGMYVFNVWIKGIPRIIAVNDKVVWHPSINRPLFTTVGSDKGMWAPLLEKSWAKVNGNYEAIEGGGPSEAYEYLTNMPTAGYWLTGQYAITFEEAWNLLVAMNSTNGVADLGTAGSSDTNTGPLNLPSNHAYSVLNVYELQHANSSTPTRLIKIRNPWKKDYGFTGIWADGNTDMWNKAGETYKE